MSIHLSERVDGRPAASAGRDGVGTWGRDRGYFYVLGTHGPQIHTKKGS